jgi:hypothetical protein
VPSVELACSSLVGHRSSRKWLVVSGQWLEKASPKA